MPVLFAAFCAAAVAARAKDADPVGYLTYLSEHFTCPQLAAKAQRVSCGSLDECLIRFSTTPF